MRSTRSARRRQPSERGATNEEGLREAKRDPGVVSASVDWDVVVGYADRLSARPGERLRVMVSAAAEFEAEVVSLPGREPAEIEFTRLAGAGAQPVRAGSHVEVPHHEALRPRDGLTVRTWVWLAPRAPGGRRRVLVSSWGDGGADGFALALDPDDRPSFEVASGGRRDRVVATAPLPRGVWSRLEAELDPGAATISITRSERRLEAMHTVDARVAAASVNRPGSSPGPLLLGAERPRIDAEAESHLDGKLDLPTVLAGPPGSASTVAAWALGDGRADVVNDRGPLGLHGRPHNGPVRAVTGHDWTGDVHDWRFAPEGYGAMHFHSDAIDDLGWDPTLELRVPGSCPSGVYGVVISTAGCEDVVPFVVRPAPSARRAPYAVLLPSFTYLAYSCERAAPAAADSERPEDRWVARNRLRSLYDRHDDGVGVYEASLLRPLTQLRPGYRCAQHSGPHGLAQDLILLDFLARRGLRADVITDHDLDAEGAAALAGTRTVITGAHPEYASERSLDALEAHVRGGGHLAYLGGNGLNGSVSIDPARPHVLELRRDDTQGLAWQALPGEHHHAATGANGGDWRRRGRPEHRLLGVGLAAFGNAPAVDYERVAAAGDAIADTVFAGLDPERPIGHRGSVLGGAAGYEVDSFEARLGSPPETVRLATSVDLGPGYSVWPDDTVEDGEHPLASDAGPRARADMVLRRGHGEGVVFSVGSIAWTGCLDDDPDNPVARVTENVLTELARERPFAEEAEGG
jgi:N,N-dimethylformamidase